MAYIIGSARVDERGLYSGGKAGDQKQTSSNDYKGEVSMQNFYVHSKGWYVLRAKDSNVAHQIAVSMKRACNNSNIGYSQSDRYGVVKAGTATTSKVNADCSSLIRTCVKEAWKDPGDFNTSNEASVLMNTGGFNKLSYTSGMKLYEGDILVTKTKGHTVAVVDGEPRVSTTSTTPTSTEHIQLNYTVGKTYKVCCTSLNIRTKKSTQGPGVLPTGTKIGVLNNGAEIKCQAAARIGKAIWIYFGLNRNKQEQWCCADSGTTTYIN